MKIMTSSSAHLVTAECNAELLKHLEHSPLAENLGDRSPPELRLVGLNTMLLKESFWMQMQTFVPYLPLSGDYRAFEIRNSLKYMDHAFLVQLRSKLLE